MECPKCSSRKVIKNPFLRYLLIATFLIALIPIIGWITAPFMLAVAISVVIVKKYKKIELMKCLDCKNQFQVSKEEYKAI
ncbi:MAG: hypothetical protein ACQET8_23215 [Bacillota bacterium]